jgi:hypothetical protein
MMLHRDPHHVKIHVEVNVRYAVAHTDHLVPRKRGIRVGVDELGIFVADLCRSFLRGFARAGPPQACALGR